MSEAVTSGDEKTTILKNKARIMVLMDLFYMALISLGLAIALLMMWNNAEKKTVSMMRAKEITAIASDLSKHIYDAGVALGGFSVTRSKLFLNRFDKTIIEIPHEVSSLKDLINPEDKPQFDALARIADLLPDTIKLMDAAKIAVMEGKVGADPASFRSSFTPMNSKAQDIQDNLRVIADENKTLANAKVPDSLPNSQTFLLFAVIGSLAQILLAAKVFFLIKVLPRS